MKNCHQFHWKKWRYIFPLSCALNRRKEYLIETRILKYRNHTENRSRSNCGGVSQQNYEKQTLHLPEQSAKVLLLNRQVVTIKLSRRDEKPVSCTWYPSSCFIWSDSLCPGRCCLFRHYSLYNSPIKPQILTTECFRSKPFTKQALEDKKCTVDRRVPKFIRSGIPSIRARIRDYARQSSLYVDLKWKYPLIKDWRKKYHILCIEVDVHSSWLIKTFTKQRVFSPVDRTYCTALRWSNNWCFIQNHQCMNDSFATAKSSLHYHQKVYSTNEEQIVVV